MSSALHHEIVHRDWMLLPLLAVLPMLFYSIAGYGGHDYQFHMTSWIELHNAWSAGEWTLGWAQWAQHGFGEPRFCFYPPISLVIGAALTFMMPLQWVPAVVVWIVLSLSGFSMYLVASRLLPREQCLSAAIFYMFNPYLMITIIQRFAIAEAWVEALLPLTFLCFYITVAEYRLRTSALLALLLAFVWLTNIPEAVVVFYAFGLLAVVLAIRQRSHRPLLVVVLSQTVALTLAAFRLGPTWQEKAWITSDALLLYNLKEHMQFTQLRPHLIVLLPALFTWTAFVLVVLAARQKIKAEKFSSALVVCLLALAVFALFTQLPVSTPLWTKLPEFKFILFPFRFLPMLSLGVVLLLFSGGVSQRLRKTGMLLLLVQAVFPFFAFTRLFTYQRFPSFEVAVNNWEKGFESVREYVPVGVPDSRAMPKEEMALQAQGPFPSSACNPSLLKTLPDEKLVTTSGGGACTLTLNTFYYPFWQATLSNGVSLPVRANPQGLLSVDMPGGLRQVTFRFVPATHTRTIAAITSFATFLVVLILAALPQRRSSWIGLPVGQP